MLISELIAELQERLTIYGDSPVAFRDEDGEDTVVESAFYDQDNDKAILSPIFLPF